MKEYYRYFDSTFHITKCYQLIHDWLIHYEIKEIKPYKTFCQLQNVCTPIDYSKPQGIMIQLNGMDLLIDGNHRLEQAFMDGIDIVKVFYITNPKTIRKFKIR